MGKGHPFQSATRASRKLSVFEVRQLREDRNGGMTLMQLSQKYGISHTAARLVAIRETYRHVK